MESSSNSNENSFFKMDKIKNVIFTTHFLGFCKQSVKGSIMAIYKFYSDEGTFMNKKINEVNDLIRNGNFVFQNNLQYINSCWINYFDKKDEYINSKFELMMKNGNFLHPSCLFNMIWQFSEMILFYVLARIDQVELKSVNILYDTIDNITDAYLSTHAEELMERDAFCDETCEIYNYVKGEDFIKVKVKK